MDRGMVLGALSLCLPLLSACGGSSSTKSPTVSYRYNPVSAHVASCAHATTAIPLPKKFPAVFPFPPGTVLTKTKPAALGVKGIEIDGFVPSTSFKTTVEFFHTHVTKTGFKVLDFQADPPNDSEGTYRGVGYVGGWRLHSIFGCPGAMIFAASAEPTSKTP